MILFSHFREGLEGAAAGDTEKVCDPSPSRPVLPTAVVEEPKGESSQAFTSNQEERNHEPPGSTPCNLIALSALAPELPDPCLPFWWFSTTRVSKEIPAGLAVRAEQGSRLPPEADYWCHEGARDWNKVDRKGRPKPVYKPMKKAQRKRRAETH